MTNMYVCDMLLTRGPVARASDTVHLVCRLAYKEAETGNPLVLNALSPGIARLQLCLLLRYLLLQLEA